MCAQSQAPASHATSLTDMVFDRNGSIFVARIASVQPGGLEPTNPGNPQSVQGTVTLEPVDHVSGRPVPLHKPVKVSYRQAASPQTRIHMGFNFWNSISLSVGTFLLVGGTPGSNHFEVTDAKQVKGVEDPQVSAYTRAAALLELPVSDPARKSGWQAGLSGSDRDLMILSLVALSDHHVLGREQGRVVLEETLGGPATPKAARKEIAATLLTDFFSLHSPSLAEQTRLASSFASAVINEPSLDEKRDLAGRLSQMLSQTGNLPDGQKQMVRDIKSPAPAVFLAALQQMRSNPVVAADPGEMDRLRQLMRVWQDADR